MRVLICFDRPAEAKEAEEAVRAGAPKGTRCESLESKHLASNLKKFFEVVEGALNGKPGKSAFDGHDLILLDNNLTHLDIKGARLTGEGVAGYLRAFTTTPYVVSVNKNPELDFDLEYLIGDFGTRADLAINTAHLENRALWTGDAKDARDGFRPWYWPSLIKGPERRRRQIKFVQENLKRPILSTLGFPKSAILALSRHAKGVLSTEGQQPSRDGKVKRSIAKDTFEQFFHSSSRSLPAEEDRKRLLNAKNKVVISRVIAGDLDIWFRRDVLGPQDVLVDVPHLVLRMPFLLEEKASDLKAWNATVHNNRPPFGLNASIYRKYLSANKFREELWVPSATFWGHSIRESDKLNEMFFRLEKKGWGDFVFCEDTNSFADRDSEGANAPKEFVAEFESPWNRRHVCVIPRKHYVPRSRLAL